jgi:hypothetical protein
MPVPSTRARPAFSTPPSASSSSILFSTNLQEIPQRDTAQQDAAQHDAARRSAARRSTAQHRRAGSRRRWVSGRPALDATQSPEANSTQNMLLGSSHI